MVKTDYQECFGDAFLMAIASKAECALAKRRPDHEGIDWTVSAELPTKYPDAKIDLQVKTSYSSLLDDGLHLHYPLRVKDYNRLIRRTLTPRLLVLITLPSDPMRWLWQNRRSFLMRHCAYWVSLSHKASVSNVSDVTVLVPKNQVLTSAELVRLLTAAGNKKPL